MIVEGGADLVEFLGHLADDLGVLHVVVHVGGDAPPAARAVNEELDEVEQRLVALLFVRLNPVIHHRLQPALAPNNNNDQYYNNNHPSIIITNLIIKINLK